MTDKERIDALRAALAQYASIDPDDEPWTVPLWQPARDALRADDEAARQGEPCAACRATGGDGTCVSCGGSGFIAPADPSPEAREAANEWIGVSVAGDLSRLGVALDALRQPPDVQAAILDELGGGAP